MTSFPWLGAAGIIILWHIRSPLLILIYINVAFPPRPLVIGMHFQTLLSPLLKVPRMVLLSGENKGLVSLVSVLVNDCRSDVSPVNNSDSEDKTVQR